MSQRNKCRICNHVATTKRNNCPPLIEKTTTCQLMHENGSVLKVREISYFVDEFSPEYKTDCHCKTTQMFLEINFKQTGKKKIKKRSSDDLCACEGTLVNQQKRANYSALTPMCHVQRTSIDSGVNRMLKAKKTHEGKIRKNQLKETCELLKSNQKKGTISTVHPKWYHCIGYEQRARLRNLNSAIYNDKCEGTTAQSINILNYTGMYPRLKSIVISKALREATAVKFLMSMLESTTDYKIDSYSWNKCLLMSSICVLEFPSLCRKVKAIVENKNAGTPNLMHCLLELCLHKFECLSFPDIEKHPELVKHFRDMTQPKLSRAVRQKLLVEALPRFTSIRQAYKLTPLSFIDASYFWNSIEPIRQMAAAKLKKFYDVLNYERVKSAEEVWMALQPDLFFDTKLLQLFSAYMVTRFENPIAGYASN